MENKHLNICAEYDYDYNYDIIFFKAKNREYQRSIEIGNIIIDLDSDNFLTGIQIMDASIFLGVEKILLRDIKKINFNTKIKNNIIEVRLNFDINFRNKIIEKNPIIVQQSPTDLPDSMIECK